MQQGFDCLVDGTTLTERGQHDGPAALAGRPITYLYGRYSALQSGSGFWQMAGAYRLLGLRCWNFPGACRIDADLGCL